MDAAIRSLAFVTLGLGLVLLLRKPARRLFGAGAACSLWILPLLFAASSAWRWPAWRALDAVRAWPGSATLPGRAAVDTALPDAWLVRLLAALWLAGAIGWLLRLALHYVRLLRGCRPVPPSLLDTLAPDLGTLDRRCLYLHAAGPAVLWAPRSRLLLPADMLTRFGAAERGLVLRHEQAHLRRGDAAWSLLAEAVFALLWFHPLAWLALPRFRTDRELACDERVLREAPGEAAGYARALLNSATMSAPPALIPWLTEPQLKERLTMIRRNRPSSLRRYIGLLAVGLLAASGALAAQASQVAKAGTDRTDGRQATPKYPALSVTNHEQGTVVLQIRVGADGRPLAVEYDPKRSTTTSATLISAATDAAMKWHFQPATRDGKPAEAYVRVPVTFQMDNAPKAPAKAGSGST